jgi:glycosyltransferase involved in cell wall biosynthesis
VRRHILSVIADIGPEVAAIYVVDDACPEGTGDLVEREGADPRVRVLRNSRNLGVGGAVLRGYASAIADGADCIVKVDGDGQMDPRLISQFAGPILAGQADYTKGNRFYNIGDVVSMPAVRLLGNTVLSFLSKFSSGYWGNFDPTNGYTAISGRLAALLPVERLHPRFFFESDLLFRLGTLGAVVLDVPIAARYGDEESNLRIGQILPQFLAGHLRNLTKRIFFNYFLRDFSIASLQLVVGLAFFVFGVSFGAYHWWTSVRTDGLASSGTVMVATLPIILGTQLLLSFLSYDISQQPRIPITPRLPPPRPAAPPPAT